MNKLWFNNHKKEKYPSFDYITNFKAPYIQTTDTWLYRPLLVNPLVSWFIHSSVRLAIHLRVCVSWLFLARMRSYTGCVSIVNKNLKWFRENRFRRNIQIHEFQLSPQGSEQCEWDSLWIGRASEASVAKRSAAEWVSGVSGASERTNVASDRVALSKRDRLWLETRPKSLIDGPSDAS